MTPLPPPEDWEPEWEGQQWPRQHEPFAEGNEWAAQPGNLRALKHGAFTESIVEPLAAKILESILASDDVAYLRRPHFAPALRRHVRAAARVELLEAWVEGMTLEEAARSDKGQTSPLELTRRWTVTVDNSAGKLGLDPVSWAKIRKDYAVGSNAIDLATLLSTRDTDDDNE